MKVTISKESRSVITLDQVMAAKDIIRSMAEDEWSAEDYAAMGLSLAADENIEKKNILSCRAYIMRNCRAWDAFNDMSGDLDVWIEAVAMTWNRVFEIGCYLTDLWQIDGEDETRAAIRNHMYIREFVEKK